MSNYKLTVAISTFGYRALEFNLEALVPLESVQYLIVVQLGDVSKAQFSRKVEFVKTRDFISLIFVETSGVSNNRNTCLEEASGQFIWFCDDDLEILFENIEAIPTLFSDHGNPTILCGRSLNSQLLPRKAFATCSTKLSKFNTAKFATFEIALDLEKTRALGVKFDTNFGVGAKNRIGDEFVLLTDILKKGGNGVFLPVDWSIHPDVSSGLKFSSTSEKVKLQLAIFWRVFGFVAIPIYIAFLAKNYCDNWRDT